MKKNLPLVLTLAGSFLLSSLTLAQSSAKNRPHQTRRVKGQILTSTDSPSLRVKFDKRFRYVGSQKFVLYERAQVEQYFFVDADDQRQIRRLYMVQFEGYLPKVDATYDYPLTKTVNLGGQTYITNAEVIPHVPAALKQNPQSDVAHAASFLESQGYRISESIMYQRFVRLVDKAKRHELILLYVEDASRGPSPEKEEALQEFYGRALKGFTILK